MSPTLRMKSAELHTQEFLRIRCKFWDLHILMATTSFLFLYILRDCPVSLYGRLSPLVPGQVHRPQEYLIMGRQAFRRPAQHPEVLFHRLEEMFPSKGSLKRASQYTRKSPEKCTRCTFCPVSLYKNNCLEIWCWLFSVLKIVFQEDLEMFCNWVVDGLYFLK